jgi:hypothetical protein
MSLDSPLIVEETKQNNKKEEDRRDLVEEVKKQLWLSGPLISVTLLNFGINLISVMFVGHLGELPLSGASMATSFASVTGFSLLVCFSLLPYQTSSVHRYMYMCVCVSIYICVRVCIYVSMCACIYVCMYETYT